MSNRKVVIIGGGVAGLSAALELAERHFDVTIYERESVPGGKARSNVKPMSGTGGRADFPGEHGFRFFPGFYRHVIDTMSRIPVPATNKSVKHNLAIAQECAIAQDGRALFTLQVHLPRTLADWFDVLQEWFGSDILGLAPGEAEYFVLRLLNFMTMCDKRRLAELEERKWWNYIGAATRSNQYRKLLAAGLTRSLVAMRAEVASTRTVGTILVQMFTSLTSGAPSLDRVLNAPTTDAWISPWTSLLTAKGVNIVCNATATGLNFNGTHITSINVTTPAGAIQDAADYFVLAVPVEVAKSLVTPALAAAAPSLGTLGLLHTEWMTGLQFYIARDLPICPGHVICADSSWALTCISQPQYWKGFDMSQRGNGMARGLISIDISDWNTPGTETTTKTAKQCTADEIQDEVWAQLRAHLSATAQPLTDADRVDWLLDPAIGFGPIRNSEPLFINTIGSWSNRPSATTEIPNLFLASDYVKTNTDLATMEGANEAARRAVNGIIAADNSGLPRCRVWTFPEPEIFSPLKDVDELLFDMGLPHRGLELLKFGEAIGL